MEVKAQRHNEGKLSWSILDFKALEPLVKVMMYGAAKYTSKYELNNVALLQLCLRPEFAITVIEPCALSLKEFAQHATKKSEDQQSLAQNAETSDQLSLNLCALLAMKLIGLSLPQNSPINAGHILKHIDKSPVLLKGKNNGVLRDTLYQVITNQKNALDFFISFLSMESVKIFTTQKLQRVVEYAEAQTGRTLIIAIKQKNSEVFFVANATTHSGCLEIVLQLLKKLSLISDELQVVNNHIQFNGRDNWKKGMPMGVLLDCAMRHMTDLLNGETIDLESGLPIVGHLMANVMMISHYQQKEETDHLRNFIKELQDSMPKDQCCGDWDENGICKCQK